MKSMQNSIYYWEKKPKYDSELNKPQDVPKYNFDEESKNNFD